MNYIYIAEDESRVGRIDDDGLMRESYVASAWPEYLAWVAEGNTTSPYVAPTVADHATDLAEGKVLASEQVRAIAYSKLQPTDWVVVREMETGVAASEEITTYRTAVRTASEDKVAMIEASDSIEDLQTYLRSDEFAAWPTPPAN